MFRNKCQDHLGNMLLLLLSLLLSLLPRFRGSGSRLMHLLYPFFHSFDKVLAPNISLTDYFRFCLFIKSFKNKVFILSSVALEPIQNLLCIEKSRLSTMNIISETGPFIGHDISRA